MKKFLKNIVITGIVAILSVSLVACGSASPSEDAVKKAVEGQKEDYKKVAELLKEGKIEDLNSLPGVSMLGAIGDMYKDNKEAIVELGKVSEKLSEFDYKISDVKEEKDKITAKIEITTYDMKKILSDAQKVITEDIQKNQSQYTGKQQSDVIKEVVVKLFKYVNENAKTKDYKKDIDVELEKSGDNWVFSAKTLNSFGSVISGGIQ